MGEKGKEALARLLWLGAEKGLLPPVTEVILY